MRMSLARFQSLFDIATTLLSAAWPPDIESWWGCSRQEQECAELLTNVLQLQKHCGDSDIAPAEGSKFKLLKLFVDAAKYNSHSLM